MEMRCPACGMVFRTGSAASDREIPCPHCGAPLLPRSPAGEIIEVRATEARTVNAEEGDEVRAHRPENPNTDPPNVTVRRFRLEMGRAYPGDAGCGCGAGCLLILLFLMMALRGCLATF